MPHDLAFADAVRPTPVVVLQLPLRPYSLGHEALLWQRRNALLIQSWSEFNALALNLQIRSVLDAVWICSNDWKRNHRERFVRLKSWLWDRKLRGANYPLGIAEFRNYLIAGRKLPSAPTKDALDVLYPKEQNQGRVPGSPLLAQLYNFACSDEFKVQRSHFKNVWDIPYSMVGYFYFTAIEIKGEGRIENDDELEQRQQFEQMHAEIRADQLKRKNQATTGGLATEPPDLDAAAAPPIEEKE